MATPLIAGIGCYGALEMPRWRRRLRDTSRHDDAIAIAATPLIELPGAPLRHDADELDGCHTAMLTLSALIKRAIV